MCNCKQMLRTWEETQGGRFPASNHAPACEDFIKERFVSVELDGSRCLMEPDDALDYMDDVKYENDAENYKYTDIYLTRDQYEKMPEFAGF